VVESIEDRIYKLLEGIPEGVLTCTYEELGQRIQVTEKQAREAVKRLQNKEIIWHSDMPTGRANNKHCIGIVGKAIIV